MTMTAATLFLPQELAVVRARAVHGRACRGRRPAVHGGVGAVRQLAARAARSARAAACVFNAAMALALATTARHDGALKGTHQTRMFELTREFRGAARRSDLRARHAAGAPRPARPPARACPPSAGSRARSAPARSRSSTPTTAWWRAACIESRAGRGFFVTQRRLSPPPGGGRGGAAMPAPTPSRWRGCRVVASDRCGRRRLRLPAGELAAGGGSAARADAPRPQPPRAALAAVPAAGAAASCASRSPRGWCSTASPPGAANIVTTFGASQAFDLLARILLRARGCGAGRGSGLLRAVRAAARPPRAPDPGTAPQRRAGSRRTGSRVPRASAARLLHADAAAQPDRLRAPTRRTAIASCRSRSSTASRSSRTTSTGTCTTARRCGWRRSTACGTSSTSAASPSSSAPRCASATSPPTPRSCAQLVERKVLSVLSGSALLESCVSEVLDGGRYKRHVEQTARAPGAHAARCARGAGVRPASASRRAGGEGIFLWGRVPEAAPWRSW